MVRRRRKAQNYRLLDVDVRAWAEADERKKMRNIADDARDSSATAAAESRERERGERAIASSKRRNVRKRAPSTAEYSFFYVPLI